MRYLLLLLFTILHGTLTIGMSVPNKRSEGTLSPGEAGEHHHDSGLDINGAEDIQDAQDIQDTQDASTQADEVGQAGQAGKTDQVGQSVQTQQTEKAGQAQQAGAVAQADTPANSSSTAATAGANAEAAANSQAGTNAQAGQNVANLPGIAHLGAGSAHAANASTPRLEKPELGSLTPAKPHSNKGSKEEPLPASPLSNLSGDVGIPLAQPMSKPTTTSRLPNLPMALVHSEVSPGAVHTMDVGESILSGVAVEAEAPPEPTGLIVPSSRAKPTKAEPAVQGATFAVGGETFTASIDRELNIVVGTSVLKPGGAAATLASGAAVVSVIPGGALVVDGGTLTMSALHPAVTGAVLNLKGQIVTASQKLGTKGNMMIIGSVTLTSGAPGVTIGGQQISYGAEGLYLGRTIAPMTTISYTQPPAASAMAWLTASKGLGIAKMSGSVSTGTIMKPTASALSYSHPEQKNGVGLSRASIGSAAVGITAFILSLIFIGG